MPHLVRSALLAVAIALLVHAVSAETIARVGVSQRDLGAMDPAYGIGNGDEFATRQTYNTLVSPPDGTTRIQADQLQGELAAKWEMSPRLSTCGTACSGTRGSASSPRRM